MQAEEPCFDCLAQRIKSDFSDELIFFYGISHSPLPFSSSAVVQMPCSGGETSASANENVYSRVALEYLRREDHACLAEYVDEFEVENGESETHHVLHLEEASSCSLSVSQPFSSNGREAKSNDIADGKLNFGSFGRFPCWRTINALAPVARVGKCSYSILEELASEFCSGVIEDHVLCCLNRLIDGKASPRDSLNFLSLLGLPSFEESSILGCLRHPNIAPILGLLKSSDYIVSVVPKTPYTLENILYYSPDAFESEWHIRFLTYQLLSALAYLHGLGMSHGNICPSSVMLSNTFWSWLPIHVKSRSESSVTSESGESVNSSPLLRKDWCTEGCYTNEIYAGLKLSSSSDWRSHFDRWWRGDLSNFEYLLFLNKLAGRRWGDHTFHPVMPWVIDFSEKPDEVSDSGWRDLRKSKWRLAKGDEQLDFTYSTSEIPHHVSDECLSELAVCSYKARRLPLSVLRMAVRSVYEPNEYPSNMQRLYQWTPDECIPEFYCDPQIFYSIHASMADLAVPPWAASPEEFIKLHRDALESHRVSSEIHHWIDIIFGYKMTGEAAVAAKNVMLPSSEPSKLRSVGRRQLFTKPHPARLVASLRKKVAEKTTVIYPSHINGVDNMSGLFETSYLEELEEAYAFLEHASHLSPSYYHHQDKQLKHVSSQKELGSKRGNKSVPYQPDFAKDLQLPLSIDLSYLLEHIAVKDEHSTGYQELLLWKQKYFRSESLTKDLAEDIFSFGCVLAEIYLRKPLFDSVSIASYFESGVLPGLVQELPAHTKLVVEACIEKDPKRRPSAHSLLESPYFSPTVKSSYLFVAPLQLLAKDETRLRYAANFARRGALKAMGHYAAEMCASYCLPLVVTALSDSGAEWAHTLLEEFIKYLKPKALTKLVLPAIQKILQMAGYSHLKVSLLQDSFVREIWNTIGKRAYLEAIHPLVISNLYISPPQKCSISAACVLLIGSSEELGVPVTIHQTILPLIHCFGKGIGPDGIDVLVRIGGVLGENFVVRHLLPLLKHFAWSCISVSSMNKPEPLQSWSSLALADSLMALDGLVAFLPDDVLLKELIEDQSCLHVMVLMQRNLEVSTLQVAASTLVAICRRIGPALTALHVLPQLKELFDELAFSEEVTNGSGSVVQSLRVNNTKDVPESLTEGRMDLVLLLYPSFASLLGIEKLRQGCPTWLLLEQYLLRFHNWKLENTGQSSRNVADTAMARRSMFGKSSASKFTPAKMLLNGVGWSIPQSQAERGSKDSIPQIQYSAVEKQEAKSNEVVHEPWSWFPSPVTSFDGPDFLGRSGGLKDEFPWKIRASVISSVRAHHGALRSLSVCQDECTVFTAGIGSGFKGTVQKWELSRLSCISGYHAHEEVVNDICVLSSSGRIASCDGTIHLWNSQTGKLISVFTEQSADNVHYASLTSLSKPNADQTNMLSSHGISSGLLNHAFYGSMYTCMHHLEFVDKLVVGTGNGSLRFIDVARGEKLHTWRGEPTESGFPSLISALTAGGSNSMQAKEALASPSWIAAGSSSGHCRLFDMRSGSVISTWRAHDGYVTKLAAPEDHLLVSSSLDKTLRTWDLRRSWTPQPTIFRGHADGVSGFSLWGQDVISISRNNIGLFPLSKPADEDGQHRLVPQKLYMADSGTRNMSTLSSISILPFSRLFLVGAEDGYLRICC